MNTNLSLLYLEDDEIAQSHYAKGFKLLFEQVYTARTVSEAEALYSKHSPHVLIIDINLPDGNGLDFIKELRKEDAEVIIIVLSAFSQREYLLTAVELHLFKYLIKPVNNSKLLSVLKEAISLVSLEQKQDFIYINKMIKWNPESFSLVYKTQKVQLSINESKMIELLMSNPQKIFTFSEIEYFVFYELDSDSNQAIKNLINRLRKKIDFPFIQNHYSIGYQIIN